MVLIDYGKASTKSEAEQIARQVSQEKRLANVSVIKQGDSYVVAHVKGDLYRQSGVSPEAQEVTRYEGVVSSGGYRPVKTSPSPPAVPSDIQTFSGTPEEAQELVTKRYASGQYDPGYSVEIVPVGQKTSRILFSKTPVGEKSTLVRYAAPTKQAAGKEAFIYETEVETPEQVSDLQAWAKERGIVATRMYASTEEEARKFGDTIHVELRSDRPIGEEEQIPVRSLETVKQQRIAESSKILGKKIYEEASPIDKILLSAHTLLSPKGYEYLGAATREARTTDPISTKLKDVVIDAVFPNIKTTTEVVEENISAGLARHARGEYSYKFDVPLVGRVEVDERIVGAVSNPVVDIELMALGGAGFGKVAATKMGGRILASKAAKVALTVTGGAYLAERGIRIETARRTGEATKALGELVTTVAGLGAATVAYKAELAHIAKTATPKEIKIETSASKGVSITEKKGKLEISRGTFKVTEGKYRGLRGETIQISGKKEGALIVKIPAQKVGKYKFEPQTAFRYTKFQPSTKIPKTTMRISSEAKLRLDVGSKSMTKMIGQFKEKALIKETGRTITKGTVQVNDYLRKDQSFLVREFKGVSIGSVAKKYDVQLVVKGTKAVLVESRVLASKSLSRIDWVDISRIMDRNIGTIVKRGGDLTSGLKTITTPKTAPPVPVPPSQMTLKATPIISSKMKVAPSVPIPRIEKPVAVAAATLTGVITKPIKKTATATRPLTAQAIVLAKGLVTPQLEKQIQAPAIKTTPITIPITTPITTVGQKQVPVTVTGIEPILDLMPPPPTPVVSIPQTPKPPPLVIPGIVPFLRFGKGAMPLKKFKLGVIKNPVPEIERLI